MNEYDLLYERYGRTRRTEEPGEQLLVHTYVALDTVLPPISTKIANKTDKTDGQPSQNPTNQDNSTMGDEL